MGLDYKWALAQIKSGKSVEQVEVAAEQCIAEANQELLTIEILKMLIGSRSFAGCAKYLSDKQIREVMLAVTESFITHVRRYSRIS